MVRTDVPNEHNGGKQPPESIHPDFINALGAKKIALLIACDPGYFKENRLQYMAPEQIKLYGVVFRLKTN